MVGSAVVLGAGVLAGCLGAAVVGLALFARNRPRLLEGPAVVGAASVTVVAGLVLLILGEASHGGTPLVYAGGALALVGVGVLTGVIAALPEPNGADAGGH
ncbi:MAG: hypothetical protein ABEJ34_04480 [Haloferacaceae archaeon]